MKHPADSLSALTLLFGAQLIRVLLPSLTWYWGATLGVSAGLVIACTYAPAALAWLAPLLAKQFGLRNVLWALGTGLALSRLIEQLSTTAAVDVWAAFGGTACFMGLLPLLYARAQAAERGEAGLQSFVLGLLLGLSLDTTLRGLTATLDLSWIPGPWPRLIIVGLVGAFTFVLWRVTSQSVRPVGGGPLASLPLLGLGPFLFVEWQILQNQGWVATLTGWPPALALGWIMLGNVAALLAAAYALTDFRLRSTRWWPLLPGGALTLALLGAEVAGWTFALGALVGLVSAGWLLAVIVSPTPPASRRGAAWLSVVFGLGLLCYVSLGTGYYFSFLVRLLPFPRSALAPLAGAGLAVCALGGAWQRPRDRSQHTPNWASVGQGALMLLAPLLLLLADVTSPPQRNSPAGDSVRVMTYNIRSAYGMNGSQDVEAIARVIEDAGTEVVALQELSRGWMLNGSTDLLPLFSRRLDMPAAVMGAATDPLFGNAILSRYPVRASGHGELPRLDALIGRGYVWSQLDWGGRDPLWIIGAHLETDRHDVRIAQVTELLKAWAGRPQTVLLGDMNARLGSPEIQMILEAGFVDAWSEAGQPERPRIDWIFHTPDLVARDVVVFDSPASDIAAYAATIAPRP